MAGARCAVGHGPLPGADAPSGPGGLPGADAPSGPGGLPGADAPSGPGGLPGADAPSGTHAGSVTQASPRAGAEWIHGRLPLGGPVMSPKKQRKAHMDLFEYQARDLFEKHGVPVLGGIVATTPAEARQAAERMLGGDRKSTRLNSSHVAISYAVFCLKKKKKTDSSRARVMYMM